MNIFAYTYNSLFIEKIFLFYEFTSRTSSMHQKTDYLCDFSYYMKRESVLSDSVLSLQSQKAQNNRVVYIKYRQSSNLLIYLSSIYLY